MLLQFHDALEEIISYTFVRRPFRLEKMDFQVIVQFTKYVIKFVGRCCPTLHICSTSTVLTLCIMHYAWVTTFIHASLTYQRYFDMPRSEYVLIHPWQHCIRPPDTC